MIEELAANNLEAFDNQNIIFTYLSALLFALNKHHLTLDDKLKKGVQQFVIRVTEQILFRGSAGVFEKLLIVLVKV